MTAMTWTHYIPLLSFIWIPLTHAAPTVQVGFNAATIAKVRANMLQVADHSWENGTAAESLTELSWPSLSVFRPNAIPPPTTLNESLNAHDVLDIANATVDLRPSSSLTLAASDEAVGDPASLGIAVLLANWTRTDLSDTTYGDAATDQLNYLLNDAPRTEAGAISQRKDEVQLWADFIYMAPPFIAYYGALQGGDQELTLLQTAYDQIRLYRDELRDESTGLWKHIVLGSWQDDTLWGTGNGWAAAGMLRVLETINQHNHSSLAAQKQDLQDWVNEIIGAAWTFQASNGTLLNALNDPSSFADSSSTALLASVTYRMAALTNDTTHLPAANRALKVVEASVDADGWLQNTVDPLTFNTPTAAGDHSPEGQAFVLLLEAAQRDYLAAISSA
ncbi:hypothetical protein PLICRDRAFT_34874 [Plicaturopsis crispa FD-325 SS-3]|nr:hypothetical protein PLICRDRAFT_34874 [Plicaturopsis crispa FD-325 SS-3]